MDLKGKRKVQNAYEFLSMSEMKRVLLSGVLALLAAFSTHIVVKQQPKVGEKSKVAAWLVCSALSLPQ